jgi:hypothetical protein
MDTVSTTRHSILLETATVLLLWSYFAAKEAMVISGECGVNAGYSITRKACTVVLALGPRREVLETEHQRLRVWGYRQGKVIVETSTRPWSRR